MMVAPHTNFSNILALHTTFRTIWLRFPLSAHHLQLDIHTTFDLIF